MEFGQRLGFGRGLGLRLGLGPGLGWRGYGGELRLYEEA